MRPNGITTNWVTLVKTQLASPGPITLIYVIGAALAPPLRDGVGSIDQYCTCQHLAQCLAYAKGWMSSYCCYCGYHHVDSLLHSGSRDNVSILSSQPEGSLQSWLSCTLSLATDTARTPSRQSAISSRILSPR